MSAWLWQKYFAWRLWKCRIFHYKHFVLVNRTGYLEQNYDNWRCTKCGNQFYVLAHAWDELLKDHLPKI